MALTHKKILFAIFFAAFPACGDGSSKKQTSDLQPVNKYSISREYLQVMFVAMNPSGRYPMYSPSICLKSAEQIKEDDIEILKYECMDEVNTSQKTDLTWRAGKGLNREDNELCFSIDFFGIDHFKGVPDKFTISLEILDKAAGEKYRFIGQKVYVTSDFDLNRKS